MKPNPDYWEVGADGKPLPYVNGLEFYIFGDPQTTLAAFRAGKLDLIGTTLQDRNALQTSQPNLLFEDNFRANAYWLQFNMKVKPWDDIRVRQAASLAIDRNELNQSWLNGDSQLTGLIPAAITNFAWQPDEITKRYPQDVDRAKQLLQDAGQAGLAVELSEYTGPMDDAGAAIIQRDLNAVGFNATIKPVPTLAVGQENVRNGNYQIIIFQGSSSFEVDDWTYLFWNTNGGRNFQGYSSPQMDQLTAAQRSAGTLSERQQTINKIQDLMLSDMVAAPLIHQSRQHNVLNPVVKNFQTFHWILALPHLKESWVERS